MPSPNPAAALRPRALTAAATAALLFVASGAACNPSRVGDAPAGTGTPPAEAGGTHTAVAVPSTTPVTPSGFPILIPRPKQAKFPSEAFPIGRDTQIVLAPGATAGAMRAANVLRGEIKSRYALLLEIVENVKTPGATPNTVLLLNKRTAAGDKISPAPKKPEGYAVRAGQNRVVIAGNDGSGVLWGAQTVAQLIDHDSEGPYVRGARINDWPSLKIRAVHLFHGQDALPFHKKLIDRIYSRYKMNAMFLQVEQVRWNAAPEVAPPWAGTPQQVREEVAYAKEKGITVYPLFQSYGHMDKVLTTAETAKFAEDPEEPYALNYSDPKAVQFLERLLDETDRTFDAPGFHFGLDEVTLKGRFPYKSKGKTFPQLYVEAAKRWDGWAKKRGKKMFMWADMAVHPKEVIPDFGTARNPTEAAQVRAGLPKDIVMITWQYQERDSFPSLKKLRQAGFSKVMAATWFRPGNIQGFSKAAMDAGAIGAVQTTWAGFESNESILGRKEREQFEAMVLAAEYFWNGGSGPSPARLPYNASEVFASQWGSGRSGEASAVAQR